MASNLSNLDNPQVYFEINIGKKSIGRVVFELFADTTPRTAENFRALCTGERGISPICGKKLHFRGCIFHRIISGFMAQGGDFTNHNGTGGESIYGPKFHDENFIRKHDSPGLLSMANSGSNTNGSQFFLTFRNTPHLDGRHVVFGKVIAGMDILKIIEMVATDSNDCPRAPVTIVDCGQIGITTDQNEIRKSTKSTALNNGLDATISKDLIVNSDQSKANEEPLANEVIAAANPQQDDEEEVLNENDLEEKTAGMTETQKRLFQIRLKLNQSRKLNKKEVEQEYKRLADPKYEQKQRAADWAERKKKWSTEVKAVGLTEKDAYMLDTAEKAEKLQEKAALKDRNRSSFGWEAFTAEATHRAYEKRLSKLPVAPGVQSTALEENPLDYGKIGSEVLPSHLDRMSKEIEDREKARDTYSRRRMSYDSSNVDFINDTNAHFNKKIKRAFDKYTVEIRQNLERGTAI